MTIPFDPGQITVIPYETRYREAFKTLNVEWLERFFTIEPIDKQVLSHPENILSDGGHIFFARYGSEIVGTCALIRSGPAEFELSKMAVSQKYQGVGIGRKLLAAVIARYSEYLGHSLYLETNSILVPAITLYESLGFRHAQRPAGPSHYQRGNVYMVYSPQN